VLTGFALAEIIASLDGTAKVGDSWSTCMIPRILILVVIILVVIIDHHHREESAVARFAEVARLAEQLAEEASRLKKRAAIATAIADVAASARSQNLNPRQAASEGINEAEIQDGIEAESLRAQAFSDAGLFCLYLAGQPFAEADPRKLNAGGALLTRVLKQVSGSTDAALTAAYRRHGDLGAAAYDVLVAPYGRAPAQGTLTLDEIAVGFDAMAGARTTAARAAVVEGLLRRATALEAKYLLKLMLGDMRIGVKQSLIEEAIAVAATVCGASADVAAVRHAVMLEADLARATGMAFAGSLAEARMRLFHPLGFMLASPVETPEEAVERFTQKPAKAEKPKKSATRRKSKKSADVAAPEGVLPIDAAEEGFAEDVEIVAGELQVSPLRPTMEPLTSGRDDGLEEGAGSLEEGMGRSEEGANQERNAPPVQAFLEDKYDGMRAQVHCADPDQPGRVAIYSRNREDITQSFPEIEEAFRGVAATGAMGGLILDGELLGWDFAFGRTGSGEAVEGRALPFSVLGQRIGRKRVDDEMRRQVPVVFMAFDLLFEDGKLLLPLPLRARRARLEQVVERLQPVTRAPLEKPAEKTMQAGLFESFEERTDAATPTSQQRDARHIGSSGEADSENRELSGPLQRLREPLQRLMLSPAVLVESAEAIDLAYADARARANEGVMLKAAGSAYLPGRRGLAWVKLKRELATLDVVITGAEFGHGRRAGLLSDYTFAVRGAGSGESGGGGLGELLNVGKAYSGVTDVEIAELTEWLKAHTLEDHGHFRTVEPLRVIEVAFNNVMRSERHSSGFALRFPRILRLRDDKPLEEIDTLERVEEIYQSQPDKPME
jgi:DNA ligase-1